MCLLGVGAISEEVLGAAANSCLEVKLTGTECFANVSFLGINQLRAFARPSLLIKHRYCACLSRPITQFVRKQTDRLHFLASHCCISPSA